MDAPKYELFTDCIIKSKDGEQEFKLHRFILAYHSDVFKAMFTSDMKEGKTNVLELPESSKLLLNLIRLMYGGEVEGNINDGIELCRATKKYLMTSLYDNCVEIMTRAVDASNAVELLIFSREDKELDNLKKLSLDCIRK